MHNDNDKRYTKDGKEILNTIPFKGVRKHIAHAIETSHRTTVGTYSFMKIDCSMLVNLRKKFKDQGYKISYTDMLIKLVAIALELHPELNASLVEDEIQQYKTINISIGRTDNSGLLKVPVIKNINQKSLIQISNELKALIEKADNNTLTMDDVTGGTFTISSVGIPDVTAFLPIINFPQAAVLGMAPIHNEAVVETDGSIVAKPIVHISVTMDHRIISGVKVSEFYKTLQELFLQADKHLEIKDNMKGELV